MQKAFGVVQSIHGEDQLLLAQDTSELLTLLLHFRVTGGPAEPVVVDAQRKGLGLDQPVLDDHGVHGGFHPQGPADCLEEVLRIVEGMKPGQVRAQDAPQDGLPPRPGHEPKDLERRKRDMQEESDVRLREPLRGSDPAGASGGSRGPRPDRSGGGSLPPVRETARGPAGRPRSTPDRSWPAAESSGTAARSCRCRSHRSTWSSSLSSTCTGTSLKALTCSCTWASSSGVSSVLPIHTISLPRPPVASAFSARARTADTRPPAFRTTLFL